MDILTKQAPYLRFESKLLKDSLQTLTTQSVGIFIDNYADLTTCDRNKKIMRDISGCVSSLNKEFFLRRFHAEDSTYEPYLKKSNNYVKIPYKFFFRFTMNSTEPATITSKSGLTNCRCSSRGL
jgi:hypothetical protein